MSKSSEKIREFVMVNQYILCIENNQDMLQEGKYLNKVSQFVI